MTPLEDLIAYAKSFLGTPYLWGGKNPSIGLDCSGFVCEIIKSIGIIGYRDQYSSRDLHAFFRDHGTRQDITNPPVGALIFYGKSVQDIRHVALVISPYSVIESGGGSDATITLEIAKNADARVRIRWINHRIDKLVAILPNYPWDLKNQK